MILSRRSLLVSIATHCSLVLGGYFLYNSLPHSAHSPRAEGQSGSMVVSRPIQVRPQTVVQPSLVSAVVEPAASSKVVAEPSNEPEISSHPVSVAPVSSQPSLKESPQARSTQKISTGPSYPQASKRAVTGVAKASESPTSTRLTPTPAPASSSQPVGWGPISPETEPAGGESGNASKVTRRAMPVAQPEFNLTARFPDLGSVRVKARFEIAEDGSYEPFLLNGSGNPTADVVILGKLLEFKWLPALKDGVPEADVRILDISLEG